LADLPVIRGPGSDHPVFDLDLDLTLTFDFVLLVSFFVFVFFSSFGFF
tara:strand:- start:78 stop:221 length:144 start_codon:yes stop_codon:yes gene_type:complete